MKKTILAIALMVTLASCGGTTEAPVPVTDSTVVTVDSAACCVDSTKVDTCIAK